MPLKIEGIDYSPEGIEGVREALISMRADAMKQWPAGIEATLIMSHAIAQLAYLKELIEETK